MMSKSIEILTSLLFLGRRIYKARSNKMVWSRVACLGKDTYDLFSHETVLFNTQKGRIDFLSELFVNGKKSNLFYKNFDYIVRKDIRRLVIEQLYCRVKFSHKPVLLLMDSYSELTDQKFTDKKKSNSFFFANYGDLNDSFPNDLICEGLLELDEKLEKHYIDFFDNFRHRYPNTPIVFICFPKKFEKRDKFILRHVFINETIKKVSSLYNNFHVLEAPEEIVEKSDLDDFPYHYSYSVKKHLSDEISKLNLFKYQ
jgi:hypothetical protein